ncbi:hypothetical protein GF354_01960 [Candidatus Peregrinibacteria bacterium]|nr:hypothetical protein [Candidatus Peregrinibacteria bacterium]
MNKIQKLIIAIISPLIILLIGYGYISTFKSTTWEMGTGFRPISITDINETWLIWLICLIIIGIIEFILFSKEK